MIVNLELTGWSPCRELDELVGHIDAAITSAESLERLAEATRVAADLGDLGDRLIDHYVNAARDSGRSWTEVGSALGVSKQAAQKRFVAPTSTTPDANWPEHFTDQSRAAITSAAEQARSLNHSYIGTEHVLLGLIHEQGSLAAQALAKLGISDEAVRAEIDQLTGPAPASVTGSLGINPRTKRVLEKARQIAKKLGHSCTAPSTCSSRSAKATESRPRSSNRSPTPTRARRDGSPPPNRAPELDPRLLGQRRRLRRRTATRR